jgi:hypothetical protein
VEATYSKILAPLDQEPMVMAELAYVDPIADIAVLRAPELAYDDPIAGNFPDFNKLVYDDELSALSLGDIARYSGGDKVTVTEPAWLLALDGHWFPCEARATSYLGLTHAGVPIGFGLLELTKATDGVMPGMSGSPILNKHGEAIGVVCLSGGKDERRTEGGPNPRLLGNLPGWLLEECDLLRLRVADKQDGEPPCSS